mmetsp:Transcript_23361/g.43395  ORF Transcript_23361/g.43395 Transcript_23361/m.43395 type:complete len:187 (+) Transcript_23361:63-623(+)
MVSCCQKDESRSEDSIPRFILCTRGDDASSLYSSGKADTSSDSGKSVVSFGTSQVREYERILVAQVEAPLALSIGWNHIQHDPVSVEDFEAIRRARFEAPTEGECHKFARRMSIEERFYILSIDHGFTFEELQQNESRRVQFYESKETKERRWLPRSFAAFRPLGDLFSRKVWQRKSKRKVQPVDS